MDNTTAWLVDNPEGGDNPPIIFGHLKSGENKKTLCVYGHLDVQPADKEADGWDYDPFKLTEVETEDGVKLYGRGSTDDKGPVRDWINVLSAYQALKMDIPVNIKVSLFNPLAATSFSESWKHVLFILST